MDFKKFIISNRLQILNLLIINNEKITIEDIQELSKYLRNIYVILDNKFSHTKYFIKLRYLSNIHIISSDKIPNVVYNCVILNNFNAFEKHIVSLIFQNLKFILYDNIFNLNNTNFKIDGFSEIEKNIFKKNDQIDHFNFQFLNEQNEKINQIEQNEQILSINQNNKNDENNISFNDNKNTSINYIENKSSNKLIKDIHIKINNISPYLINYSNDNKIKSISYGRCDVLCIIKNKEDVEFLKKLCKENSYGFVKYFIFLNNYKDSSLLKIFKTNQIIFDFFNFQYEYDEKIIRQIFNLISDGEYKINMYDYDFNKDITEIIK